MKNRECIQNEIHPAILDRSLLNTGHRRLARITIGNFRKMFFIASLAGIGLLFNGCVAGYVETEPSFLFINRPPQPSNVHIWIDGGWGWNSQSHGYVHKSGYWEKPRQGQIYKTGYWQSSPKGKYWQNGRWEKQNGNNRNNRH